MTTSPPPLERACPLCQQQAFQPLYRPRHSPGAVGCCQQCGFIYIARLENQQGIFLDEPPTGAAGGPLPAQPPPLRVWGGTALPGKLIEGQALRRNHQQALERLAGCQAPGRLLDFGCGWGFFLETAREAGWEPYGLEPRLQKAEFVRSKLGIPVVASTLRDGLFPAASFDAITAFQVFEHLLDPGQVLDGLHTLLKPGGILLLEAPNIATWGVRLFGSRHRHFAAEHINFFSPQTLQRMLENHGYAQLAHYAPDRYLTVYHLTTYWLPRLLPTRLASAGLRFAHRRRLLNKILALNLGDILGVIARKTG